MRHGARRLRAMHIVAGDGAFGGCDRRTGRRAYAHWLAAHGCSVVVSNRTAPDGSSSARAVTKEIVAAGGRAVAHDGSVETPEAAAEAAETQDSDAAEGETPAADESKEG